MTGIVREGRWRGQRIAVKMSDLCSGAVHIPMLQREVAAYGLVTSLQGDIVPQLVTSGWTWGGGSFFLATALIDGYPLSHVSATPAKLDELKREAEVRLQRMHALNVAHGDVRLENLIVEKSRGGGFRVVFLDLALAHAPASAADKQADMRALQDVFRNVVQTPPGDRESDTAAGSIAGAAVGSTSVQGRLPSRLSRPSRQNAAATVLSDRSGDALSRLKIIGEP